MTSAEKQKLRENFEFKWNSGGGFMQSLCKTIVKADLENLGKLHKAYPDLVDGYCIYSSGMTYHERVR